MVIAVDIDGVLTLETEGFGEEIYWNRTPWTDNIRFVNNLYKAGHHVILYSARYEEDRQVTVRWLRRHKVKYHELILEKPKYDLLIDDRAVSINSFYRQPLLSLFDRDKIIGRRKG